MKSLTMRGQRILEAVLVTLALLLGAAVRLYDLKDPPLDFHATRQLRSAILARDVFYRLNPGTDPATRQAAYNLAQLEVYEPPLLEWIAGATDVLAGGEYFWIGRIYNTLFWTLGGLALYALLRRFTCAPAAMAGLLFYLFLPFSVIASRSFQPDPWMVFWIVLAALALYHWSESKQWKWALAAGLFGGMAMLVKVFAAFFIAPMMAMAVVNELGWRRFWRHKQPWAMGVLALAPALLYYLALNPARSGDFFSFWMVSLSGMVRTTEFYADWLAMVKGLMGLTTLLAAVIGFTLAEKRARGILLGGWVGYGLFGLAFPYQYVTHEYYHLALVPLVAVSLAPLADAAWRSLRQEAWLWRAVATGAVLFAAFYGLYVSRSTLAAGNFANEPESWRRVGQALPAGRPFVALTSDYGMRLNYYGWRSPSVMWPSAPDLELFTLAGSAPKDLSSYFDEMVQGKDYFLVTALAELDAQPELKEILTRRYPLLVRGSGFLIYDLTHPLSQ